MTADLLEVQEKVRFQLLHVELKVAHKRQLVHLLNEEHCIVFGRGHEKIIISQPHETIKFNSAGVCCARGSNSR
jgi:hypothetical protein